MAKWCDEGENRVLNILFNATAVDASLYMGLYTDAVEPAETATLASLTEATGTGYGRITLSRGTWTVTDDHADYAQQTFTAGSDWGNIYGYFIGTSTDDTGKLLCVEHFTGGPFNVLNGGSIKITPKITCA